MTARIRLLGTTIAALALAVATTAMARDLAIGTSPPGSVYERASGTIADMLRDRAGLAATVRHFAGTAPAIAALDRGEVQLALILAADLPQAESGVRLLCAVLSLPFGVAVPGDSPVRAIADLKGRAVSAAFADQPAVARLAAAVLANGGLAAADVIAAPVRSLFDGAYRLGEGRLDAALAMPGIHALRWAADRLAARGGIRFVPLDTAPAAVAAMRRAMPVTVRTMPPGDGAPGVTVAGYPVFLAAHAGLDTATAGQVTAAVAGSLDGLAAANPVFRYADAAALHVEAGVPYHDGALAALRAR